MQELEEGGMETSRGHFGAEGGWNGADQACEDGGISSGYGISHILSSLVGLNMLHGAACSCAGTDLSCPTRQARKLFRVREKNIPLP